MKEFFSELWLAPAAVAEYDGVAFYLWGKSPLPLIRVYDLYVVVGCWASPWLDSLLGLTWKLFGPDLKAFDLDLKVDLVVSLTFDLVVVRNMIW